MENAPGPSGPAAPSGTASAEAVARLDQERSDLRSRLSRLTEDMASLLESSRDSNADDEHDPEGQTIAYERSQLSAVTRQAQEHLSALDAAIERAAAGTYGICEVCGQRIDEARLEARPTARSCVHHVRDLAAGERS